MITDRRRAVVCRHPPIIPKSPPRYLDLCSRRRLLLEVQILNREIGFLEVRKKGSEGRQLLSPMLGKKKRCSSKDKEKSLRIADHGAGLFIAESERFELESMNTTQKGEE